MPPQLLAQTIFSESDETIGVSFTPDGYAEAYLQGEAGGQRIRQPLGRVRAVARQLGLLSGADFSESIPASPAISPLRSKPSSAYPHLRSPTASGDVNVCDTQVRTMHIVFPERESCASWACRIPLYGAHPLPRPSHLAPVTSHTDANSKSILFGGQTMAWMEEAAIMSARHLVAADGQSCPSAWRTVAMDGLEFRRPVHIGE